MNNGQIRKYIKPGFTLVEIMIVLVILGLLAGLVVPRLAGRADQARVHKIEADLATLATALSLYQLDNRQLPTTAQGLQALQVKPSTPPVPQSYKASGYIESMPIDPWGQNYLYLSPAEFTAGEYDLFTFGADGKKGGEGQDADVFR